MRRFFLPAFLVYLFANTRVANGGHLFLQAPQKDRSDKLNFGQTTCVSQDGRRIAIGANGYDKYRGALYVYDLASGAGNRLEHWRRTRLHGNDTIPAEEKQPRELRVVERGSGFGFSCAMSSSSNHILVGAPGHALQRGAVYIFSYNAKSRTWEESEKLSLPDQKSGDVFGWAMAVSEGGETIAISAKGRRANNGEVYVFSCKKLYTECELSSRLTPPDYTDSAGPRGIRIRNNFGISIAMNSVGDRIAVGCIGYNEERGAVYVYSRADTNWNMIQRLESPNAEKFGFFGYKISMDHTGEKLAVGADGEKQYTGAVYMFRLVEAEDGRNLFKHQQYILEKDMSTEDNFGGSVALSGSGRALVVGAPGVNKHGSKDHGAMYIYEELSSISESRWELAETVWLPSQYSKAGSFFGWTVGMSSNGARFVATAPSSYSGAGLVAFGEIKLTGKRVVDSNSLANDEVFDFEKQEL